MTKHTAEKTIPVFVGQILDLKQKLERLGRKHHVNLRRRKVTFLRTHEAPAAPAGAQTGCWFQPSPRLPCQRGWPEPKLCPALPPFMGSSLQTSFHSTASKDPYVAKAYSVQKGYVTASPTAQSSGHGDGVSFHVLVANSVTAPIDLWWRMSPEAAGVQDRNPKLLWSFVTAALKAKLLHLQFTLAWVRDHSSLRTSSEQTRHSSPRVNAQWLFQV